MQWERIAHTSWVRDMREICVKEEKDRYVKDTRKIRERYAKDTRDRQGPGHILCAHDSEGKSF